MTHYHVTRNGQTLSWASIYTEKRWAQDMARQSKRGVSARKTDVFGWHAHNDDSCQLYREYLDHVASTGPVSPDGRLL